MYQHEESDEDDYEGYFLKPVNGYNIADRVMSANKELFEGDSSVQSGDFTETLRRVSFRSEPDYEPSDQEVDEASSCDEEDIEAINQVLDRGDELVVFEEQKVIEVEKKETENHKYIRMSNGDSVTAAPDDEIEEICEEIDNVDLSASDQTQILNEKDESSDAMEPVDDTILSPNDDAASSPAEQLSNLKDSKTGKLDSKSSSAKASQHHHHHNNRPNSSIHTKKVSESQFLKIQLNFKPCCEYKYLENERLPRYCGYVSQYGLSKEQLEMREKRRERLKERKFDKTAKQLQVETMKSEVNEEAFARWLQNKMRNSRSMTKNMFDYRPPRQIKKGKKKV